MGMGLAPLAAPTARTAEGDSDADGEIPVARCRAGADRPQRVPDTTLEGRAGRAHGDLVERGEVSSEVGVQPFEDRPRRIREGVGCRVGQGQAMRERLHVAVEIDGEQDVVVSRNGQRPDWRVVASESQRHGVKCAGSES